MRGDTNVKFVVANVVDTTNKTHYHIIPTVWVKYGIVVFILSMALLCLLSLVVLFNRLDLNIIRDDKRQRGGPVYDNTSNTNRQ